MTVVAPTPAGAVPRPRADEPRPRRLARLALRLALGVALVAGVLVTGVYAASEWRMRARVDVPLHPLAVHGDPATVAWGAHLVAREGCAECHGADLGGHVILDDAAIGTLVAPNLTPGRQGAALADADWERAVRHGVRRDGTPLLLMPAHEYTGRADDELAAMIAYLRTVPAVDRPSRRPSIGPLARLLLLTGDLALVPAERVAHAAPHPSTMPAAPTAAYGAYLASGCIGCHGARLAGGPIAGGPPDWPPAANLTPAGLGRWTHGDFVRALRTGRRPDGSPLRPPMSIGATSAMTDVELAALWAYLRTLPALPTGTR